MTRIAVAHGAPDLDETRAPRHWSLFPWQRTVERIRTGAGLMLALQQIPGNQAEEMTPLLSRQTPLAVHMFRYTRATLRAYQERGLVRGLAARSPEDIPVVFQTGIEQQLYHRIDELCGKFYRLADLPREERNGVGFLMAVFRKRLASSFAAFQKSLERRRDLIEAIERDISEFEAQIRSQSDWYREEEDDDDEIDVGQAMDEERRRLLRITHDPQRRDELQAERLYLQDYITALRQIPVDSKFEAFRERLSAVLDDGRRVIVFTQFLDTLDFIRERLVAYFGDQMACYTGRGGEVWDFNRNTWRLVEKSEIKARCRHDHPRALRILLGTEAASEGLNLQQFSALVNYDLPWNPMRVEQRIGRIDRIGQEASTVRILNLYVQNTIEEDTYHTLKHRIGAFEEVVGPLQPILAEMPRIFRRVARGELELAEARRLLDEAARRTPDVAISSFEECVREDAGRYNLISACPTPGHPCSACSLVPGASRTGHADRQYAGAGDKHPHPGRHARLPRHCLALRTSRTSELDPQRKSSQRSAANWLIVTPRPAPLRMNMARPSEPRKASGCLPGAIPTCKPGLRPFGVTRSRKRKFESL